MPRVRPFPGLRYSDAAALGRLVCPPYDVISSKRQEELHDAHPANAIRLELARDSEAGDRYASAAATFERWMMEGVLTKDEPSLYVYRQDFVDADGTRRRVAGILGALELETFGRDSGVLPHERTMAGPKEDRLALLRALPVNISPIYAIYRGGGELSPYLDSLENRPPVGRFVDDQDVLHRLWVIASPAEIEMLSEALAPGPLVIADGHHRYETALAFSKESSAPEAGSVLCFCVDADAEGLVVLPYNRLVRCLGTPQVIRGELEKLGAQELDRSGDLDAALTGSSADHPFVILTGDSAWLVEVSDAQMVEAVGDRAAAWRALDVVALHEWLLPRLATGEPEFSFTRDPHEVMAGVETGEWAMGVLLRSLAPAQIVDVARSGERMPQKASYFWPKAVTGLVFRSLR
jgi:uncharacterized protein (DUF1015 family)